MNMNCDINADGELQQQIQREVRMQEGVSRLLAACTQRDQALEASKTLLTCNARLLALLGQLQRQREAQVLQGTSRRPSGVEDRQPCTGKLAISGLRIPLMWKDSEYFKNKGELHQCAVFCLLRCGKEIRDTGLVMVDRTLTDICFEDAVLFTEVDPRFRLRVELYSSPLAHDAGSGSRRRSLSLLGGTLGVPSGRRIRAAFDAATACGSGTTSGGERAEDRTPAPPVPAPPPPPPPPPGATPPGPRFHLLGHATLTLEHVQDRFKTHDLCLTAAEESPCWLPLYGNMCCRLVAQPVCMTQQIVLGRLRVQSAVDGDGWEDVYGVLRGPSLLCYRREKDMQSDAPPLCVIPVNRDAAVSVPGDVPQAPALLLLGPQVTGEGAAYAVAPLVPEGAGTARWLERCQQHLHDLTAWQRCCGSLMTIEEPAPRKPGAARQGSLYHEIVTPPAGEGHTVQDLSAEITDLLASYYQET